MCSDILTKMELNEEYKILLELILNGIKLTENILMEEIIILKELNEQLRNKLFDLEKKLDMLNEVINGDLTIQKNGENEIEDEIESQNEDELENENEEEIENENEEEIENEIEDELEVEQQITEMSNKEINMSVKSEQVVEVYRIGKNKNNYTTPIKVKLLSKKTSMQVIEKHGMLKETKIYFNDPKSSDVKEAQERREESGHQEMKAISQGSEQVEYEDSSISDDSELLY